MINNITSDAENEQENEEEEEEIHDNENYNNDYEKIVSMKNKNDEEEINKNDNEEENESNDSSVPLVTLNFLSICQCCKNPFNSIENIPFLFKCGHFFCKKCILEQFSDDEGIKCPNDGLVAK